MEGQLNERVDFDAIETISSTGQERYESKEGRRQKLTI